MKNTTAKRNVPTMANPTTPTTEPGTPLRKPSYPLSIRIGTVIRMIGWLLKEILELITGRRKWN